MNKAFVREDSTDDGDDGDELPAGQPSLPACSANYMTRRGYGLLQEEFEQLVKVERPELVRVVAWAAGNGDRSENGDYIYGKKRLREIDRRLRYLSKRLESAVVVDPAEQANLDQVFFGAKVSYVDLADAGLSVHSHQIVGVDEADVSAGRISWISPLARALMKARVGDVVRLQTPAGVRELEIEDISYGVG